MRVCIVYDSKHGTTEKVAKAIWRAINKHASVDINRVNEGPSLKDYDLVIIGTPIYYEKPLKSVLDFLDEHRKELKDKKVAVFVVCFAIAFGSLLKWHIENYYIKPITDRISGEIVGTAIFKGGIGGLREEKLEKVKRWAVRLFLDL